MDAVIVFTAQYLIILAPLVFLQLLWTLPSNEKFRFVALSLFSLLLAIIFAKVGSQLYDNPRPFDIGKFVPLVPHGIENGFPSLHTLIAATMAALVFTRRRITGTVLFVMALLIGVARFLGGVHHGIDIIASLCIAVIAVVLAQRLLLIKVYK